MVRLVIKNGRVVTPDGTISGGVVISGEKIVSVVANDALPQAKRVIDARQGYVIPGLIDPHVHMGSEEDTSIEEGLRMNVSRETEGALHGGITTFGHFIGGKGISLLPALEKTISAGEAGAYVDFICHAFISDESDLKLMPELVKRGVTSFKHMFTAYKAKEGGNGLTWLSLTGELSLWTRTVVCLWGLPFFRWSLKKTRPT